eukprot:m.346264 g.346264  ORF g.346264 m.346264 type:complete len:64 (+) comp28628_c0_seq1:1117-1308(+)
MSEFVTEFAVHLMKKSGKIGFTPDSLAALWGECHDRGEGDRQRRQETNAEVELQAVVITEVLD